MDENENTYDTAEAQPATEVTLAQWARAEALKAVLQTNISGRPPMVALMVNSYAELIISGSMPTPPPGVSY